jgi:hypothetical protein
MARHGETYDKGSHGEIYDKGSKDNYKDTGRDNYRHHSAAARRAFLLVGFRFFLTTAPALGRELRYACSCIAN